VISVQTSMYQQRCAGSAALARLAGRFSSVETRWRETGKGSGIPSFPLIPVYNHG